MRISDWSSDVCSSDLVRLSRDERHDNIEHEGPDLARETVLRGMKDADHHGLCSWLVVGEAADALKPRQRRGWSGASRVRMGCEIGRESCRERVWQYV